jgi:ubiquitin
MNLLLRLMISTNRTAPTHRDWNSSHYHYHSYRQPRQARNADCSGPLALPTQSLAVCPA